MNIKQITIKNNEPYLRQISKLINFDDPNDIAIMNETAKRLDEFCSQNACFAMASVQLERPVRMIFLKHTAESAENLKNERKLLINPKMLSRDGRTRYWEACMSCPDELALVERPYKITVEFFGLQGDRCVETFEGFSATVVSHELDHLDGILHRDRAIELLTGLTIEEIKEIRQQEPYKVLSKTQEFSYDIQNMSSLKTES